MYYYIVNVSLQTHPAARIVGKGFKWTTDEPGDKDNTRIGQFANSKLNNKVKYLLVPFHMWNFN